MEPMILLYLLIMSSRCSLNFNLVSRIKPRSLWLSDILAWDWFKESGLVLFLTILGEKQISVACFLGSVLNSIFHWKARYLIIMRSSFNTRSDFLKSWHFENQDMLSASILLIDWIPSRNSLIYIKKMSGQKTDLCETPERALSQEEVWSSRTTLCLRSVNFQ